MDTECTVAENATASTVGKVRNAKYGLRNASWRIVPATDIAGRAFVYANVDGAEITVKTVSSTLRHVVHPLPLFCPFFHIFVQHLCHKGLVGSRK